ncbi:MAG: hypothetical protein EAZ92_01180 [Candidatus Kapaibacterium sp.]|nr:MAG: hypothetical protein EAZ92_01180 [Candidatus Kapabacteria bacterium]
MKQFLILVLLFCSTSTQRTFAIPTRLQPVNAVIGDISYLKTFGTLPTAKANEQVRLRTHLAYVERLLRSAHIDHLSTSQKAKRAFLLDRLHEYWVAGQFPKNLDYTNERRPCFIDRYGNICAVGYWVAIDEGWEVAELINAKAKYAYVHSMKIIELDDWVNQSGLSKLECAMIQPGYSTYVPNPALTITKVFPSVTSAINQPFQILLQANAFLRVDIFPWGFDPMYLGSLGSPRISMNSILNTIVNPTTGTVTVNPEYNMILNIDSLALSFFQPGKKYQ